MSEALRSSLAEALGIEPAVTAVPAPPPQASVQPPSRVMRLGGFRSLRIPEAGESGIGDIRASRRSRERQDLATPSALIKRAMDDWPQQAEQVAALAVAMGVQRGEAWRRVIVAGIAQLSEDYGADA